MSAPDLVTFVEFDGRRVDVTFRVSEMMQRAERFLGNGIFTTADLAMEFADMFVLGTIRERARAQRPLIPLGPGMH